MSAIFALLAALSNALFVTTQHVASTSGRPAKASGLRLVGYLFHSPLWLFGWAAGLGAFVFQASALKSGQLSIVQALLVTELVFGLVLRKLWIGQSIRPAAWWSAALTCAGLAAFVAIDEPQGGTPTPTAHAWISALAVWGGAAAIMALAARWGSPTRRAALYAAAAAIVWALEAAFIKAATETLTESGLKALFTHWPVYALAVGGIAGTILVQAALHVGPLRVSQPLLVIVDPSVSVILSVWLFQEHYNHGPLATAAAVVAFVVMCVGVVALTSTAPPTMEPVVTARGRGPSRGFP
ncbi:MAG TPA: DMT family transporter [Solirubrobacteraceae bacterium]|nr:DMT family transporter [Solirubrobacteraceae bacterium]